MAYTPNALETEPLIYNDAYSVANLYPCSNLQDASDNMIEEPQQRVYDHEYLSKFLELCRYVEAPT